MNVSKIITLKDDEEVLAVARNHWITRLRPFIVAFAFIALPLFFLVPLVSAGKVGLIVLAVGELVGAFIAVRASYLLYWNAFVVTNKRVIDVDQRGFFSRTVSEAPYDRIQDVTYSVKGLFAALVGYGALTLQTAGSAANLELSSAADPKQLHHLITSALEDYHGATSSADGGRGGRVTGLLEAAGDLNDAEARAFLTAIQKAVGRKEEPPTLRDEDLEWYRDRDDGGEPSGGRPV